MFCLVGVGVLAASTAEREDEVFERMKNSMVSHTRFLQSIEILKSIIWDEIKDMEEEKGGSTRKKRLNAGVGVTNDTATVNRENRGQTRLHQPNQIGGHFGMLRSMATKGNLFSNEPPK